MPGARLGGLALGELGLVLDTTEFNESICPHCDDVLGRYRVGLDLAAMEMRLWPAEAPIAGVLTGWFGPKRAGVADARLFFDGGNYAAPFVLGGKAVRLDLDTGCADCLLDRSLARLVRKGRKVGSYDALFAYGKEPVDRFEAGSLRFAGRRVPGRIVLGVTWMPVGQGCLGCDAMRGLRVLMDYPGRRAFVGGLDGPGAPTAPTPR